MEQEQSHPRGPASDLELDTCLDDFTSTPATDSGRQHMGDGQVACPPQRQMSFYNSRSRTGMKQFSGGLRRLVGAAAQLVRLIPWPASGGRPSAVAPVHVAEPLRASSGRADPSICTGSRGGDSFRCLAARGTPAGCGRRCLLILNHWLFHLGCFSFDLSKSRINKFSYCEMISV